MKRSIIEITALRKLRNFAGLPDDMLKRFLAEMEIHNFKRKTVIFDQGDTADFVYFLLSGVVKISWLNQARQRVLVRTLSKGAFFGLGRLFAWTQHPYRCETVTDCAISKIRPDRLVDILMGISFDKYLRAAELLTKPVWESFLRCVRGMRIPLRQRLALELLDMAASFGVEDSRGTILSVRVTHEDLADSIGFSRPKVTQTLVRFERQGAISREGRRLILNTRRLRDLIGEA